MKIQIPGKTFLLGEYAVLQGGTAVIACTEPYFELKVSELLDEKKSPFHPQSPAGKFIADHPDVFHSFHFDWLSPYPQGGFGGSTAEFLACFIFFMEHTQQTFSQASLYGTYLKYAYDNKGVAPSGADLIAQAQRQEGLAYFESISSSPSIFSWPFTDISLLLFKTPYKLPTHDHLQNLKKLSDYTTLKELTVKGYQALLQKDQKSFIDSINFYAEALSDLDLTADATKNILKEFVLLPTCLAAKGCGALGVDVIAVIAPTELKKDWIFLGKEKGLTLV